VAVEDCRRIVDTYLVKLFDVRSSDVVCVSGPTTVDVLSLLFKVDVRILCNHSQDTNSRQKLEI